MSKWILFEQAGQEPLTLDSKQLAADCKAILERHYPGHGWVVYINDDATGGIMGITCETLLEVVLGAEVPGYLLYLKTVLSDPARKCVINAGGEILERCNLPRARYNDELVIDKVDGLNLERFKKIEIKES